MVVISGGGAATAAAAAKLQQSALLSLVQAGKQFAICKYSAISKLESLDTGHTHTLAY